ncbi:hypothetical protein TrVE_jg774 [Triparma verrucosa]|nr:hypothetical protein TrVE_jg774 [Triparma verrucosa]
MLLLLIITTRIDSTVAGWVDPSSQITVTTSLIDGTEYDLVMSDEFETDGRGFADGEDSVWTALDKSDDDMSAAGGGSLHFYNSSHASTSNGFLNVSTTTEKTTWTGFNPFKQAFVDLEKDYKSAMVNSWNKFCFTGGIVEIDAILPGEPNTAGLWPAMWILGNLGRATYEGSTNGIWPWSYDTCDRRLQHAQHVSGCSDVNHYGLNARRGRGSTEIDILELMPGEKGWLPSTFPKIQRPYGAMTLQVAPGVEKNRPQSGSVPVRVGNDGTNGFPPTEPQSWYEGLGFGSNTSMNPFFYGTYLGETKPEEPTHRTKKEAFQADAVGAMFQLTKAHFERVHTYRMEWQPGKGGRIDWFVSTEGGRERPGVKKKEVNKGDEEEEEENTVNKRHKEPVKPSGFDPASKVLPQTSSKWTHAFSIEDESLSGLQGSQVPAEPSYLIFNTAVSSTWGFPYDTPDTCKKCYSCFDPDCACAIPPGFCESLKNGKTSMLIDSVRVYQAKDDDAHVGNKHTVGCDPIGYPTREFIEGHESLYMRPIPFTDKHALLPLKSGGGKCTSDDDCGEGVCTKEADLSFWSKSSNTVCNCGKSGYMGSFCKTKIYGDDEPGAYDYELNTSWFFKRISIPYIPVELAGFLVALVAGFIGAFVVTLKKKKISGGTYRGVAGNEMTPQFNKARRALHR